jgi:hypothetical protein
MLKRLWCALLVVVITGCASMHTDWNARIGHYTFDDAVKELGLPDRQAKLSTGQLVAEWITRYPMNSTVYVSPGIYGYGPGGGFITSTAPAYYESILRLTFETNNVMSAWAKK